MFLIVHEACAVVGLDEVALECLFIFGELLQIAFRKGLLDVGLVCRIDQCDDCALETCAGESATIDTRQLAHDVVNGNQLGAAAFVVVDG